MAVTIYIDDDGMITIDFPVGEWPDKDTVHAIWEVIQDAKKRKSPAGEQTGEGQSLN